MKCTPGVVHGLELCSVSRLIRNLQSVRRTRICRYQYSSFGFSGIFLSKGRSSATPASLSIYWRIQRGLRLVRRCPSDIHFSRWHRMDPRGPFAYSTALKMSRSAAFVGTLIGRAKKRPMQFYETMKSTTACHYRMQSMKLKFSIHSCMKERLPLPLGALYRLASS